MLQRGTMPTVSARAAELSDSWHESFQGDWVDGLRAAARLPSTPREFLLYSVVVLMIAGALAAHLLIAVQILNARVEIQALQEQIVRVEQINSEIVYATTLTTSVDQMVARAKTNGYAYTTERRYVAPMANADDEQSASAEPDRISALGIHLNLTSGDGAQTGMNDWRSRLPGLPDGPALQDGFANLNQRAHTGVQDGLDGLREWGLAAWERLPRPASQTESTP
jgi:hypothetical protein